MRYYQKATIMQQVNIPSPHRRACKLKLVVQKFRQMTIVGGFRIIG
ncbi:MAG: hypothetical protein JO189_24840 [Deltaproteobacteria bacterium]|nr:hypothetical protein [Deltaproteobacteria bacterium]